MSDVDLELRFKDLQFQHGGTFHSSFDTSINTELVLANSSDVLLITRVQTQFHLN